MNDIFMRKRFTFRLSVMLFLLMGAIGGAWAQTGTLVRMETTAESVKIYVTYTGDEIKDATGVVLDSDSYTTLYPVDGVITLSTTGVVSLKELDCYSNGLTSLDVSSCTELVRLSCGQNDLTSLDVSGCPNLSYLSCGYNDLTSLDISVCPNLKILYCAVNSLTSLDVSVCPMLERLDCVSNKLSTLNMSGCMNLTYQSAGGQTVEVSSTGGNYLNPIFYTSILGIVQDIRIIETTYAFNEALPTSDDMRVFTIPGTLIYGRIFFLGYESVTSVSLNESSISLEVGNSETLVANLTPANATNQEVTWSSSNPLVATVSDTGEVYAEAEGTTIITVTTVNGGLTATCDVTVQSVIPPTPVCITEQPQDAIVCLGSSHTFGVVATGSDLHYQWYKDDYPIGEATSPEYTINSTQNSDYAVYKVRVSGSAGDFVESSSVTLWVADPLPTDLIFAEYPTEVIIGNTYLLKLSDYADVSKYSWSFSKEGVRFSPEIGFAGENETQVTFDYPSFGIGTLKATLEHPCGTREVTQTIEVKYPAGIEDMTVETVKLYPNPTSDILKISGTKANETLTVFDITGSRKAAYQTQEGITTIDISGFPKGTYLLQYKGKSYKVMKK